MHIDSVEILRLALPLKKPLPAPREHEERFETVLVRIHSGDLSGWGEASPGSAPIVGDEWTSGVFGVLQDCFAPAMVKKQIGSGDELGKLLSPFHGNRFAKAALDMAWWDLSARQREKPLHDLLGGKHTAVEVGVAFDRMDSIEEFFAGIGRAFDAGFFRVKLMLRPGWEIRMLEAVRKEFPRQALHVDVDGALTIHHTEILYRLDDFFLAMVEQPLSADDLVGHAMLQESMRTPICLGRSIRTVNHAEMALELHSGKYVALDLGRVGGLTNALAIHDLCHDSCTPCYASATPTTTIAARHEFALASKANCTYPAEYFPSDELLAADVAEPLLPMRGEDGKLRIHLGASPGIGVQPEAEILDKYCVDRAEVRAK
jgi:O-succinylbenzoate synthase